MVCNISRVGTTPLVELSLVAVDRKTNDRVELLVGLDDLQPQGKGGRSRSPPPSLL
jgi:hypothetical protein